VNRVQQLGAVFLTFLILLLVASYFLAMLLGPALFFFTPAGLDFSQTFVKGPPIMLLLLFAFYVPFEVNSGQLFMFLWGVFVLCFAVAWRLRESLHEVAGKIFSRPLSKIFNNWLFVMPIIASVLFSAVIFIINIQDRFGIPTGAIPEPKTDFDRFNLYLNLSYAPLVEEIGFRITPIGTFLLAYLFLIKSVQSTVTMSSRQRFKLFLYSFLYPDGAKKMVGDKTVAVNGIRNGISRGEWVMLLITSVIFGVAHVISPPPLGWEVGKFTSTFVQGFVFGIVYLAYGFQACILLHWFFNYYFYTYELSTQYYSNMYGITLWIENINLTLGRLGLIAFTIWGLMKISRRFETAPQEPSAPSP